MVRLILCLLLWASPLWAEGNLKLEILRDPDRPQPVVGEMIPVTIRATYDRKIALEKLEITGGGSFDWVQTHPDDWHEEMIDGLPWIIMERKLALWPKVAGALSFGPAVHHLTVIDKQSRRQEVTVTAQPLMLSVGEFPELHGWHHAAENIELTQELSTDPAKLADGEVVTRLVKLRVQGSLPEHVTPRPVVQENWLITFTLPTQRELLLTADGPVSEVTWGWQFRPLTGEPGVLDPVQIPYFNSRSRQIERVEIPAMTIGYASFYTGQVPTGQIGAAQLAALGGLAALGLLLGLGLGARSMAPERTGRGWRRFKARYSPFIRWQALVAKRRGDLLTLRRIEGEAERPPETLARLERQIYARPDTKSGR